MFINRFVWADLSSYDVAVAERFYGGVLGWAFADSAIDDYRFALFDDSPVAAVYPMPEKFAKIKMPPFWMPYIAVESAAQTAKTAGENGGKVEVLDQFGNGEIALIRDPSGAGFSIYDGGDIASSATGIIAGYELFVPDAEVVRGFYENTFNWRQVAEGGGHFRLIDKDGNDNTDNKCAVMVQEAADDIRGNKQYWAVHFAVDSLADAKDAVRKHGGHIWEEHKENQTFASSPGGEFFILSGRGI
ncbi:MAG: VOC family protein [Gammaproteobacteria bacterium]